MTSFILASASPRRQALIQLLQRPVSVHVADVDEDSVTEPDPAVNVVQTAKLKAEAVADSVSGAAIIVAADTTVALGNEMLNKPADEDEACAMLLTLRGRTHQVHTGIALLQPATGRVVTAVSTTAVTMRHYSRAEVEAYVASGDPLDKAGAYAIQHAGFHPVSALEGCFTGVVGLSLCRLANALAQLDVEVELPLARESHDCRACGICLALVDSLF